MNDEDVVLYRQAEGLTYSGQTLQAYEMFRALRDRGNTEIEILFWMVETTPNAVEARQTLDAIKHLQPGHPLIPRMEALHNRKLQTAYTPVGPVLLCPYCGARVPAVVKRKISTGGWIWFAAFFVVFVCFMTVPVPVAQTPSMEISAFFCLGVGIVGLFVIRKSSYACGHCGSRIADAH
jgi:hypothetical protein